MAIREFSALWYLTRPQHWLYIVRFHLGYFILPAPQKRLLLHFNEQLIEYSKYQRGSDV